MVGTADPSSENQKHQFARALVEAIFEACPDGILVVDENGTVVSHNQHFFEVFGIDPDGFTGGDRDWTGVEEKPLLAHGLELVKDPDAFLRKVEHLYAHPELDDYTEIEMKDGRTLERHSTSLWADDGSYLGRVWFFRDVTDRKRVEQTLRETSHRDPLTGVANRRDFYERADEEMARARRYGRELGFIMLDIDHFKRVNDTWGHAAGDRVLIDLCVSVDPILREEDVFARMGGEEFAVLLPDTDLDGAYTLAERIREKIMADGSGDIDYTLSAGVAKLMPDDVSSKRPLQRADAALYEAKRDGRNRTYVTE